LPISLVAEHGAGVRPAGRKTWQTIEEVNTEWKQLLEPALRKYASLAPGARVEVKPHSLVWHYRAASPYYAQKYAVIIKRVLKPELKKFGLELVQGNKVLEIKNPRVSKGEAARRWLKRNYDFILAVGDDATDEDLFAVLPASAYSIKVGRGRTQARNRVLSSKDVIRLLRKLV
ncbi:MAG TPA: trehalose-phosphatase, partial [Candidatus Dormibacteraeota bacterium]|nr:trehalose-phosphatase [Candidatus Dormibacteraeota bacterium]